MKVRWLLNDPQNHYNPSKQHRHLLREWLLEGFTLVACKKKMVLRSVSKLRETPFQLKSLSYTIFQCLCMWNLTLGVIQEQACCHMKKHLEKLCVFPCEGKISLALSGEHIFHLATGKKFQSPVVPCLKKLILDPAITEKKIFIGVTIFHLSCCSITTCSFLFSSPSIWSWFVSWRIIFSCTNALQKCWQCNFHIFLYSMHMISFIL